MNIFSTQEVYRYMEDLLAFQACKPRHSCWVPGVLFKIQSPLSQRRATWEEALRGHPDRLFAHYICVGLQYGFRIGFGYNQGCRQGRINLGSALDHPVVVRDYLGKELERGRVVGPLEKDSIPGLHVSPLGVIPKDKPGEWRMIAGRSVNDGISEDLASLTYVSVDNIMEVVSALGVGSLLAKVDIKSAYRVIPIFPEDRLLLGMEWEGARFMDTVLSFGLRSTLKIFNAVADALQWILRNRGVFHYLDDYIIIGGPGSIECEKGLRLLMEICEQLGVPLAPEKVAGPSTCLTFLGFELDTVNMQIRLPQHKLGRLLALVTQWKLKKCTTKQELQCLTGHLQHASKVVPPGRCLLRRIFELMAVAEREDHLIQLNVAVRADLHWWSLLLEHWNGCSVLWCCRAIKPEIEVVSDASGTWGCGAGNGCSTNGQGRSGMHQLQ